VEFQKWGVEPSSLIEVYDYEYPILLATAISIQIAVPEVKS